MEVQRDLPRTRLIRSARVHARVDWHHFHDIIPFFTIVRGKTAVLCSFNKIPDYKSGSRFVFSLSICHKIICFKSCKTTRSAHAVRSAACYTFYITALATVALLLEEIDTKSPSPPELTPHLGFSHDT